MSRLSRFIHFYTDEDEGNGGGGDPGILKTVSGALIHITDALAKPLKKLVVNLEPIQASGTPTPENPLPITGWTGCKVIARGANIATVSELLPSYGKNSSGITVTESNGKFTFSGTATASGTKFFGNFPSYSKRVYDLIAGQTYIISAKMSNRNKAWIQGNYAASNGSTSSWITLSNFDQDTGRYYSSFSPSNSVRIAFLPVVAITNGEEFNETIEDIQLCFGNTQKAYVGESQGTTISIDFATSGENLYDASTRTEGYYIAANGAVSSAADSCYSDYIPVTAGETYTWSGVQTESTNNNKRVHAYANGVWKSQITYEGIEQTGEFAITFQVPSGANQIRVSEFLSDTNVQVKHSIESSIYGCTLTINEDGSGELVVDKQKLTGTSYTASGTRVDGYYARLNVSASYVNSNDFEDFTANIAEIGTYNASQSIAKTKIAPSGTQGSSMSWMHFYVPNTVVDYDPEGSLTLIQCMTRDVPPANWEIIAPLSEPITYQLTSQQVITLLQGENNVWSDAQSIEITYVASANSDDLNAADSLNLLLGNAYTRGDVPDEEALQIIMGETR